MTEGRHYLLADEKEREDNENILSFLEVIMFLSMSYHRMFAVMTLQCTLMHEHALPSGKGQF